MSTRHGRFGGEGGFALFGTVLAAMLLVTLGFLSLMISNLELRSTSHYRTGNQSFYTAEAGLLHALSVINARGVLDFQNDIVLSTQWSRLYGSSTKTLSGGGSYQVVLTADTTSPTSRGRITGYGFSDLEARRILRVDLRKGAPATLGALYMAADDVESDFGARDQFLIDGKDYKSNLTLNPGGVERPGIAARNDQVVQEVHDSLSASQEGRVQGLGYTATPPWGSVMNVQGPSVTDLDQIVNYILSHNPVTTVGDSVLPSGTYGTLAAPKVTHLTNDHVRLDGSMTGAGILIADGEFTINGSANFIGWVIVRGDTIVKSRLVDDTLVDGNATILGSLWTGDLEVQVGGAAIIAFCLECMNLADTTGNGGNVPKVMDVVAWREIL